MSNNNSVSPYIGAAIIGLFLGFDGGIIPSIICSIFLVFMVFIFSNLNTSYEPKGGIILSNSTYQSSNNNWAANWQKRKELVKQSNYNYIIETHNMNNSSIASVDDGIKKFSHVFNVREKAARPFFENQYVQSILGISSNTQTIRPPETSKSTNPNFWSDINQKIEQKKSSSEDRCFGGNCQNTVTAFDFRCFKCRQRFCESCKGSSITCPSCS